MTNQLEKEVHRSGLYYVVPAEIMDSPDLEPLAKLLYSLLSGLSDQDGKCFPSDDYLSKRLHCSVRQAKNLINQLERRGLIDRDTKRCPKNPFKTMRIINVYKGFKKSLHGFKETLPKARLCPPDEARPCPQGEHVRAPIVSEASLVSEAIREREEEGDKSPLPPSPAPSAKKQKPLEKEAPSQGATVLANSLLTKILAITPSFTEPNLEVWARGFDIMLSRDKRTPQELEGVISWALRKSFWGSKFLCPASIAKNFDKAVFEMNYEARDLKIRKNISTAREIREKLRGNKALFRDFFIADVYASSISMKSGQCVFFDQEPEEFLAKILELFELEL